MKHSDSFQGFLSFYLHQKLKIWERISFTEIVNNIVIEFCLMQIRFLTSLIQFALKLHSLNFSKGGQWKCYSLIMDSCRFASLNVKWYRVILKWFFFSLSDHCQLCNPDFVGGSSARQRRSGRTSPSQHHQHLTALKQKW